MRALSLALFLVFFIANNALPDGYLYQWDSGSGTSWTGWTYSTDVRYGRTGYTRNIHTVWMGEDYPEMFEKSSYGDDNLAIIDITERAPSTSSGGSFKVYDTGLTSFNDVAWWVWYGREPLSADPGITDSTTNRWEFYIKLQGVAAVPETGAYNAITGDNFQVGTYLCWENGGAGGEDCPTEGANQHWYHNMKYQSGAWIKTSLDRHPGHRRGACNGSDNSGCVWGDDHPYTEYGRHYYEYMHQFYMEVPYDQAGTPSMWLDEMSFRTASNENEASVTSLWVGYWPADDYWRMGWMDMSFQTASGPGLTSNTWSAFEIRYSTSPITNANWDSATKVSAELYAGTGYTGTTDNSIVRRSSDSYPNVYTRFKLPDAVESGYQTIYFAVKDVSATGSHVGSIYPWNSGDAHNSPSASVRTIEYSLRPPEVQATCLDGIQNGTESGVDCGGDCGTCLTCYRDYDNDLYGVGISAQGATCPVYYYQASHFTSTTGDCDDNDQLKNPGGADICGQTDRNCDNVIDPCPTYRLRWGTGSVGWGTGTAGQ